MALSCIVCSRFSFVPRPLAQATDTMRPAEWRQIEGMRLNKPNYDMMTALTMVGVFQRSRAYSISPFQDPLSPNKVIPLIVCIAEWNVCVYACMLCTRTHGQPKWKCIGPQQGSTVLSG